MSDKFDRFTKRARRVLTLAQEEAENLKHSTIYPGHIFLALLREENGVAVRALRLLGGDLQETRTLVLNSLPSSASADVASAELKFDEMSEELVKYSVSEAHLLGHKYIGTEHLLLGLSQLKEGNIPEVFRTLYITPDELRLAITEILASPTRQQIYQAVDVGDVVYGRVSEKESLSAEIETLKTRIELLKQDTSGSELASKIEEIARIVGKIEEQGNELNAPIVLPPREDMNVRLVPSHSLERLEEYRSDESIAFLLIGIFGGAVLGVIINWVTDENITMTRHSIVLVSLFVVLTALCILGAVQLKKRSSRILDKLLHNDISDSEEEKQKHRHFEIG